MRFGKLCQLQFHTLALFTLNYWHISVVQHVSSPPEIINGCRTDTLVYIEHGELKRLICKRFNLNNTQEHMYTHTRALVSCVQLPADSDVIYHIRRYG